MVDPDHAALSITRQCYLLSIARSSFYYEGKGESPLNLRLMRRIDEQFLETPVGLEFRMRSLNRGLGHHCVAPEF